MLTTFEQVRDWITDNGFKRWVLYRDRSKSEKIVDSAAFPSEIDDKLAMTEKYLRLAGGNAYAAGAQGNATSDLTTTCEIRLSDVQQYPQLNATAGVGAYAGVGEAQLRETIKRELQTEWDKRELARERAQLEKDKKAFEAEKQSAMGVVTELLAPIGKQFLSRKFAAGLPQDTDAPVSAAPIQPLTPEEKPSEAEEPGNAEQARPFTDEEEDELYALLAEFKSIEPDYLKLLRAVVKMAKAGDATYTMAKGVLIKQL